MGENQLPSRLKTDQFLQGDEKPVVEKVKRAIQDSVDDLKAVSAVALEIQKQGGLDAFFEKSANIRKLAGNVEKLALVEQRTLDLMMLLFSAAVRSKQDYNTIIDAIEILGKSNEGNFLVLDYLIKVKATVDELKRRNQLLESLITYSNELRDIIESLGNELKSTSKQLMGVAQQAKEVADLNTQRYDELKETEKSIEGEMTTINDILVTARGALEGMIGDVSRRVDVVVNQIIPGLSKELTQLGTKVEVVQLSVNRMIRIAIFSSAFLVVLILALKFLV